MSDFDSSNTAPFVITVIAVFFLYIFAFIIIRRTFKVVNQSQVIIVERFGRYSRTLKPGLHFLIPFVDSTRSIHWRYLDATETSTTVRAITTDRVDLREHVIDFGRQHVITQDTVQIDIDALVYFRITDPRTAVFKVQNLPDAVELLTQTTLRNLIAQMTLDDTFSSREKINWELLGKIQRDAERWGVTITRVEIFNILPPNEIRHAMENQIKAERERRSTVLQADGQRESAVIRSRGEAAQRILLAEGKRAADLLRAKGQAQAKVMAAEAEAKSIEAIAAAVTPAGVRAVDYVMAVEYLNAMHGLTGAASGSGKKSSKVVLLPSETVSGLSDVMRLNGHTMSA